MMLNEPSTRILVQLEEPSWSPSQPDSAKDLQQLVYRYVKDMIDDLAIPVKVEVTVEHPKPEAVFSVSINNQICRMRRKGLNTKLKVKALGTEICNIILQNREMLIDASLATIIADSARDHDSTARKIHVPGLSRQAFHDYLRLLVRRCFRVNRGADLGNSPFEAPKLGSAQACFEEAVKSPKSLRIELSKKSINELPAKYDISIENALVTMQESVFHEFGVRVPRVELCEDPELEINEVRLKINDLRLPASQVIGPYEFLVNETPDRLFSELKVIGKAAQNPATGQECAVVSEEMSTESIRNAGRDIWGRNQYIALAAAAQISQYTGSFIVLGTVEYELEQLRYASPGLVEVVTSRFDVDIIAGLLRYVVDEGIGYRNLRNILEALLTSRTTTEIDFAKKIVMNCYTMVVIPELTTNGNDIDKIRTFGEAARISLRRYSSLKYTNGESALFVYLVDSQIESLLRESAERPLTQPQKEQILDALEDVINKFPPRGQNPLILTSIHARRPFRELIEIEFPKTNVISFQELNPDMYTERIGKISLSSLRNGEGVVS